MNNFENILLTKESSEASCTIFTDGTTNNNFCLEAAQDENFYVIRSRKKLIAYEPEKLIKVLKEKRNFSNIQDPVFFLDETTGKRVFQLFVSDASILISEEILAKIVNQLSGIDAEIKSIRIDFLMKLADKIY